ncbi:tRNA (guanine-N(1)-)-methyltransferase [bioreactor metagenome]|uniref:tRNA (guanine-N(1)-)-methyltransferase n=1 Tax=bioreactor metagenome TaxID=1076179 RepID=A0A645F489_9ZZZZ
MILLCGHYEGVDERIIEEIVDEEISIGNYVLTGGELPAAVVVDCVSRLVDKVLPADECFTDESIYSGLLEYPQYTRPPIFHGKAVPEVLSSGNHARIAKWRHEQAVRLTLDKRPDLICNNMGTEVDIKPERHEKT